MILLYLVYSSYLGIPLGHFSTGSAMLAYNFGTRIGNLVRGSAKTVVDKAVRTGDLTSWWGGGGGRQHTALEGRRDPEFAVTDSVLSVQFNMVLTKVGRAVEALHISGAEGHEGTAYYKQKQTEYRVGRTKAAENYY